MNRFEVGRVGHLETRCLWPQQIIAERRASVRRIKGTLNPADLGTKDHPDPRFRQLLVLLHTDGVDDQNPRRVGGIDRINLSTDQAQRLSWTATIVMANLEY